METGRFSRFDEQFQACHSHALERVRRRARFKRAAAQHRGARLFHSMGDFQQLATALDAARAGDHSQLLAANTCGANRDDRVLPPELAAGQFVGR